MGLLTILKKIKWKEQEIRILILGLDNAGKTTVVRRLCGESITDIEPTLGFHIRTLVHNKLGYTLHLWDVGGQGTIRAYWRNYYEQTDGVIWVVDSTDRDRLDLCRLELQSLLVQEKLVGAPLLVLANKQDFSAEGDSDGDALSPHQVAEILGLHDNNATDERYKSRHWAIYGCSAVTGEGLSTAIDWMVNDVSNRLFV